MFDKYIIVVVDKLVFGCQLTYGKFNGTNKDQMRLNGSKS